VPSFVKHALSKLSFVSLFWKEEMELTLVGLQNSGKTTLVNVISVCSFSTMFIFLCPYLGFPFIFRLVSSRKIRFPRSVSTCEKSARETSRSRCGISEVSLGSEPCGSDTVAV
jgi:hypothetical protein